MRPSTNSSIALLLTQSGIALCWLLLCLFLVPLVFPQEQPYAAAKGSVLRVEKVFEYKPPRWKRNDVMYGQLDSVNDTIYLFHQSTVRVVNWRARKEERVVSYASLPCASKFIAYVSGWEPIPDSKFVLMSYCDSLYLVEKPGLQVARQLLQGVDEEFAGALVSPDGKHILIGTISGIERQFRLRFYSTRDWNPISELPMDAGYGSAFSLDGKYLALRHSTVDENKHVVECGVEMREVPSARLVSKWWVDRNAHSCPHGLAFAPAQNYVLASHDMGGITFWDAKTGAIIRRIVDEQRRISSFFFTPDGRFLIGNVHDDPEDAPEYEQEFRIWDIASGKVVYESPRKRWPPLFFKYIYMYTSWTDLEMTLSRDGQYLLLVRHPNIRLYKISTTGP